MSDINSLIRQVQTSSLPKKEKDALIKRIIQEGPDIDLLDAVKGIETKTTGVKKQPTTKEKIEAVIALIVAIPFIWIYAKLFWPSKPATPPPVAKTAHISAPKPTEKKPTEKRREDTAGGAHVWAKSFVEQRLRSPSTAKFASVWDASITDLGGGKWRVVSYVDAQNAFGAMIRSHFMAEVKYVGGGRWELETLVFDTMK